MTLSVALLGTDLIGQARTGTGKTLAFGIPLLQRTVAPHDPDHADLADPDKPQALVVAPTRELAIQVASDLTLAAQDRGTRIVTIYGGVPYEAQLETLQRGVEVVVGTPGRLLDLANRRALDLSHVKVLVLDEADEMLDLGFLPDVEKMLALTTSRSQTLLFSATMPGEILTLARRFLKQPLHLRAESADETSMVPTTQQHVFRAHALDKMEMLARILQTEDRGLTIVFCRTKRLCDKVGDELTDRGFAAAPVHGDLAQAARERALRAFRAGKVDILVATDVAARGIDISGVTHVINYACPEDEKVYLHRIGRTGRAGAEGTAITLVDWDDLGRWSQINAALKLPFGELVETYSTSAHLYEALDIPKAATGRLPRSARKLEGLEAEALEDIGGKAPRARSNDRPGDRAGGRGDRDRRPEREPRGDSAPRGDAAPPPDKAPRPAGTRTRRRRSPGAGSAEGGGVAVAERPAASAPATAADDGTGRPKRRRRRGGSRGAGGEAGSSA
jgi:superfamily II DNA/RNA helicase